MEMELTKRAAAHSFGTSRTQLKSLIMKKVLMPIGTAGLVYGGYKAFGTNAKQNDNSSTSSSSTSHLFAKLLPLFISIAQAFIAQKKTEAIKETIEDNKEESLLQAETSGILNGTKH